MDSEKPNTTENSEKIIEYNYYEHGEGGGPYFNTKGSKFFIYAVIGLTIGCILLITLT
jgi:hypothetical protein